MRVCKLLFEDVTIDELGNVYICCACRISKLPVGNIFETPFEKIWNSELVIKAREEALKGNYLESFCNKKYCQKLLNKEFDELKENYKPIMEEYPKSVGLFIGEECNAKCIFCRDKVLVEKEENFNLFRKYINDYYLDICKNVEFLVVNRNGDAFSRFSKEFIKKFSIEHPHIKFKLMTNGIMATKENFDEIDIYGKIEEIMITISATKAETHEKLFRVKAFKQLIKNLHLIKELKQQNKIKYITFNFIICQYNYKEILPFIKFAKKFDAFVFFTEVKDFSNDSLEIKYNELTVHIPHNKNHKKLKHYLTSPLFDCKEVTLSPELNDLRNKAILEKKQTLYYKLLKLIKKE